MNFFGRIANWFANNYRNSLIEGAKLETMPGDLTYVVRDLKKGDKLEWSFITTCNFNLKKVLTKRRLILDVRGARALKELEGNREKEKAVCTA